MASLSRFGLDAWALLLPWSALVSLGLLLGIAAIGYRALIFFGLPSRLGLHSFWQVLAISPALGSALLCAFIYPWILFGHAAAPKSLCPIQLYLIVNMDKTIASSLFATICVLYPGISQMVSRQESWICHT